VNLLRSGSGRAFMAIHDNEIAASMGVEVAVYKTLAFGVSAGITGVAGVLGPSLSSFVAPDSYTIALAITQVLGMVVGGLGWMPGSFVGAAFIIFVSNMPKASPRTRRVRRAPVPRHLPRAPWGKADPPKRHRSSLERRRPVREEGRDPRSNSPKNGPVRLGVLTTRRRSNSPACFTALMKSPPESASTSALEACACSREDDKPGVSIGCFTAPTTLAPVVSITLRPSALSCAPSE
jgi:hypothetical protein